jgi:hypothetical protein
MLVRGEQTNLLDEVKNPCRERETRCKGLHLSCWSMNLIYMHLTGSTLTHMPESINNEGGPKVTHKKNGQ